MNLSADSQAPINRPYQQTFNKWVLIIFARYFYQNILSALGQSLKHLISGF